MKIQIEELKGRTAYAFCRRLKLQDDAPDEKLEVYRGDMLSFTIPSIKRGALLMLVERDKGGFQIQKYKEFK